jgi:signal transduction histidine kinase
MFLEDREAAVARAAVLVRSALLGGDRETLAGVARAFLQRERAFEEITVVDANGDELHHLSRRLVVTPADLRRHVADPERREGEKGVVWGDVITTETSEPWVTLAAPLGGRGGMGAGFVLAVLNVKSLWALTAELGLSEGGRAYVVDETGRVVAADDPGLVLKQLSFAERGVVRPFIDRRPRETPFVDGGYVNERGIAVTATGLPLPRAGWSVVVEYPEAIITRAIRRALGFSAVLSLLGLAVSVGLAHVISRKVTEPITRLREGVQRFGQGDLAYQVMIETPDEVGELARQFNQMADQLHASHERLEQKVAEATRELSALYAVTTPLSRAGELDDLLDAAAARILEVTQADAAAIRLTGMGGKRNVWASRGFPAVALQRLEAIDLGPGMLEAAGLAHDGFRSTACLPLSTGARNDGVIILASREAGRLGHNRTELFSAIAHQIAVALENARLYEAAERALREVEAKNAELDTFVYSVSHDLKAPLVTMQGMAGLLLEDCAAQLGDRGTRYLQRLQANVQHMERLISDLLALSRVGREARAPEAVNLADVIDELVVEMDGLISSRGAKVIVRNATTLWGIRTQLQQVIGNLLSNAIKYASDTATPVVEIGTIDREGMVECYVKDDGIGIDPAYHAKIFEMFQRLKEVETEGTGVGLAIVKKIVESAGGRIWVESAQGHGSTFRFTSPKPRDGADVGFPSAAAPVAVK